jgi:hypothetical protein
VIEKMRSIFFQRSKSSAVAGCAARAPPLKLWRKRPAVEAKL